MINLITHFSIVNISFINWLPKAKILVSLIFFLSSISNNAFAEIVTPDKVQRYNDSKLLIESDYQFHDTDKNLFNAKGNVLLHYYPKDIIAKSSFATFLNNSGDIQLFGKVFVESLNGNNSLKASKFIYNTYQEYFYATSGEDSQVHLKIIVDQTDQDLF